ncbi:MAG: hypothetical protein ACRYG8_55505 [Janthinobacterium lividum]
MSKSTPAEINSFIIARKGEPAPMLAAEVSEPSRIQPAAVATATPEPIPPRPPRAPLMGTIAVTVRLDPLRYEKLKTMAVEQRETNQAILVAALDAYLRSQGRA